MAPRCLPRVACRYDRWTSDDARGSRLIGRARAALLVVLFLGVGLAVAPVHAGVSPFWQELAGSASGDGVSQTPAPKSVLETSVAVDGDGQPVVVYAESPDGIATQGPIIVKRWNGSAFETLSAAVGQGYLPQVRISPAGNIYVAWLQDDVNGNSEIHLRVRAAAGTTFDELGTSDSAGGIIGMNASITFPFSLAVGANDQPGVAFLAAAETSTTEVTSSPAIIQDTLQVYVRRWNGSAWEFLGGDFSGADGFTGGGASSAVSFDSATVGSVLHWAEAPALTLDDNGTPVVAFAYATWVGDLLADNTDIYVTTWNGTSWEAVGPPVPAGDGIIGRGGAGGVSNSDTSSLNPSLASAPDGKPALAWEETSPDGTALYVWVRMWDGSSWVELAASATDSGFTQAFTQNGVPQIAVGPDGRPVVAWIALTPDSASAQIFVKRWNGSDDWVEPAFHSATEGGISDAAIEALAPALALTPSGGTATPGVPAVAWLDSRGLVDSPQVFLRQLFTGARFPLTVGVSGPGAVASDPIGLECAGLCTADFPSGTLVNLIATPDGPAIFGGWSGGCSGTGACSVTLDQAQSVNASFRGPLLSVAVPTGGGRVTSNPAGIDCRDACATAFAPGTSVTLTATKDTSGTFAGWGGACSLRGTNTTCTLVLDADTSVSAAFRKFRVSVAVAVLAGAASQGTPGGVTGGDIACADNVGTCFTDVPGGSRVVLQAAPQPSNRFVNWSTGPCAGRTNATCDFVVAGNTTSTALFRGVTGVRVLKAGNGTGTVTGTGIACGADCFEEMLSGARVTLTPAVATGTTFRGWSGDACDGQPTGACTFTVAGNRSVPRLNQSITATFQLNVLKLAITRRTNGRVVSDPLPGTALDCGTNTSTCQGLYDFGTAVVLRATADPGADFTGWAGVTCLAGGATNVSCAFKLTANTTAMPTFRPRTFVTVTKTGNGAGTVSGPGISCGTDCTENEFDARLITLTVAPMTGSRFAGWDDTCAFRGTNTSCAFVPATANQSVVAAFELIPYTLTVTPRPNGTVATVDPLPDPIDCGAGSVQCSATLNFGTLVRLQATPIPGSKFVSWTGCTAVVGANCSFTMTANRTVAPAYRDVTSVSLTKTGQGTVTSTPAGITCGTACTSTAFEFARNTLVKLTAAPVVGWDFLGWSGDRSCPGTGACSFNASTPTSIAMAANFSIQLKTLRVTVLGNGSVTGPGGFACNETSTPCAQLFPYGTVETLTPAAAPGFKFTGWSQDCAGVLATTCKPLMTANHSVTATFKQVFGVTVTRQGNAAPGAITTAPAGINCGTDCAEDFQSGTMVTFNRAAPPVGRAFRWLGDCAFRGANASCALTINANTSVIADYSLQQLGLTVNVSGPGSVTGLAEGPCAGPRCVSIVNYGVPLLLHAAPSSSPQGELVSWVGCTTMSGANCSITMTANRTVTATFQPTVTDVQVKLLAGGDPAVPLAAGARRQYSAIATFSDATQVDVTSQAKWSSANTSVVTVLATSGLATGGSKFGTTSITAVFSTLTSSRNGSVTVVADAPVASTVTVSCSPFGEPDGPLSCLPSGRNFEVECRASASFLHDGATYDVTEQVTWTSTNAAIARFLGLSGFGGPVVASFRILPGIAAVRATLGTIPSSGNTSLGSRWAVQGTPLAVTNVTVAPSSVPAAVVGTSVPLGATATLVGTTGTATGCSAQQPRNFSLLTAWTTVPDPSPVADVNVFGRVEPLASGDVTVHWTYPETLGYTFSSSTGNFSSSTSAGAVRFSSGTFSAINHIYVQETDRGMFDVSASLDAIASGALIRLFEEANPGKVATFTVTAVFDAGSYRDYTVTPVAGSVLTNGARIGLTITFQGDVPITVGP